MITKAWYRPYGLPKNYDRFRNGVLNLNPTAPEFNPQISANDNPLYLPGARIGEKSKIKQLALMNTGEMPITIDDILSYSVVINGKTPSPDTVSFSYADIASTSFYWLYINNPSGQKKHIYWKEGNLCSEPLFKDRQNNDYALQQESPCIDAGDPFEVT